MTTTATGTSDVATLERPGNSSTSDSPAIPHPAYTRTKERRDKCRVLFDGTPAVREGTEAFLAKLPDESDDSYAFRVKLCAVFNGYERTVKASVGLMLETDPVLGDDMPQSLKDIAEDVDLKGTHLSVYTERLAIDGVIDGFTGTLADFPVVVDPARQSSADEKRQGLRPYCSRYLANDILQVRYGKIDGVVRKTLVVLREVVETVSDDSFAVKEVTRYLVYRHTKAEGVTWESWTSSEASSTPTIETRRTRVMAAKRPGGSAKPFSKIPFSLFAPGQEKGPFEFTPPLENLADLNIEHHQVKTNARNLETLAMVPDMVRIGAKPDKDGVYPTVIRGSRSVIEAPRIEGVPQPIYWTAPDVSVLDPGYRSLQDIKADMGSAGLAFLTPDKRAAETVEAKRIDSAAQNATVSSTSRKLQDHLEEVFQFLAEFTGDDLKGGSITLNRDFENTIMDSSTITALGSLAANGKLSIDTLLMLLEKGGQLPEGFDREAEIRRILTENTLPPEATA